MNTTFIIGILGSLTLVTGAAWCEKKIPKHPTHSIKNWLFAIGGLIMLSYSTLGYLEGGPIFFIFLQGLVGVSSILMMINAPDKIDVPIILTTGLALTIWSLYLFEDYSTIFFILGLVGIGLGYAFENNTIRRNASLTLGSILIAIFSFLGASWIFFWLNIFFAIFSGYYLIKSLKK